MDTDGSGVDVERAGAPFDVQIAPVRPFVAEAFSSSVADDNW